MRRPLCPLVVSLSLVPFVALACGGGGGGGSKPKSSPKLDRAEARTEPGPNNDRLEVEVDSPVVESEIEDPSNWTLESPVGTPFDLTGATIDYDPLTRTASILLDGAVAGTAANGNNLQTGDDFSVALDVVGENGQPVTPTPFVPPVGVVGDYDPPNPLVASADGSTSTCDVRISEPSHPVPPSALWTGVPGDPGVRFELVDMDGIPGVHATGSVAFTGVPSNGDTVVIDDGTRTVTFEFQTLPLIVNTPTLRGVLLGIDALTTATTFSLAVNDVTFSFDVSAALVGTTVDLMHDSEGVIGNAAIVDAAANLTVTGMAGGVDQEATVVLGDGPGYLWHADDMGVTLDFSPAVPELGTDVVRVYGLVDLAGNQLFPDPGTTVVVRDTSFPGLSLGNSLITALAGEGNDEITIEFATPMSPYGLLDAANFSLAGIDLSDAGIEFDGDDTVTIHLEDTAGNVQFGLLYGLSLLTNPAGNMMTRQGVELPADDTDLLLGIGDSIPILIGTVTGTAGGAAAPNSVILTYPEAIDPAAASLLGGYTLALANPTSAVVLGPRTVRLDFAGVPVATDVVTILATSALDLAGNLPLAALAVVLGPEDLTAPTATSTALAVADSGGDLIELVFSEPVVGPSVVDPASYAVTVDGQPLDLTGAVLSYDSGAQRVRMLLPEGSELPSGASVAVVVGGVADAAGNLLAAQPGAALVGGDTTAPDFVSSDSAFVNWIVDLTGRTVHARFAEDVDPATVENVASWSSSGLAAVQSVDMFGPRIARIVTSQPLETDDTLSVTGVADLAGNVAGLLTVAPLE